MEEAARQQQQQTHPVQQIQQQALMTKLPGLTSSHGTTTLIDRSGQCYQLHRPHLALPPSQQQQQRPSKRRKTEPALSELEANSLLEQQQQQALASNLFLLSHHHHHHQHRADSHRVSSALNQRMLEGRQQQQQQQQQRGSKTGSRQPPINPSTHVSCLYPEILALIFSNLSVRDRGSAAQVCAAWREAAYHRSAWRGVEAKLHLKKNSSPVFHCLERRGVRKVQVLSLTQRRGLVDVFKGVPKLQSLNLSGCYNMSDGGLNNSLCQAYPSLARLNLSLCKNLTDASLHKICFYLKNLQVLELGGCSNITNNGLHLIAWGLSNLRRLDLRSCWNVSDQGVGYLAGLDKDAEGTLKLERLSLQDNQRLTDEGLRHLALGLGHSLQAVNLSFCVGISDAGMKHLARVSSLRELNLRSCDNISESGIAYLVEGGSRISSLDFSFCEKINDQALQHISQGLLSLRSLSMTACPVTDEGILKIAKTQLDMETLNIGQCNRLTDRSMLAVLDSMRQLRHMDVYGCTKISEAAIEKMAHKPILLNRQL